MLNNLIKIFYNLINIENKVNLDDSIVINFTNFRNERLFIYFLLSKIYAKCYNLREDGLLIINIRLSNKHIDTIIINLDKGSFSELTIYFKLSKLYLKLLTIKD